MRTDSGIELRELRVDGGASTNDLLMQIQADVTGIPVVRTRIAETTALGAAYLAGLAMGVWSSAEEIDAQWQSAGRFEPRMDPALRQQMRNDWRKAIERMRSNPS